jgi:class 3 adenylate cyclase
MAWRADRDPEQARQQLGPVLECMMDVVHRYEGTTNQVLRDGMMVWFGVSIVHQDYAVRACYATLAMQTAVKQYAAEVQRTHGVPILSHMGLNAGAKEALGRELAQVLPVRLEEAHALTEVLGMRPL